ncbi:BTAD domain-containing putative transcriptional regulator [Phytoactinopolyspora limicola]|uniref:BTAD domain-containing putative transcriptional regulator n=1 Tax=Phytoactinopolyspora limicola TaxID=2715536 RepID=UPI00140978D1|nr:BTAD domain-containing putative transcriptional regulator [Phytoactinopolyspora limicola]
MKFGVLGPVVVWPSDGTVVTIAGFKVRALLADLLAHEGRPVSADRLIDDLWSDDDLPGNPAGALHTKVSQLRRALDTAEPGARDLVESAASGYRLRVSPDTVDAQRFTAMLTQAHSRPDAQGRVALLTEALALWRGPAFGEVADLEFARGSVLRLEEQRLVALESLAEARLELGEHTLLVGELGDLVAQHPLRERLRAAQLRALYGSGRQGEALDAYDEYRHHLRDALGLDPGSELVTLHQAILRQDPALTPMGVPAMSAAQPTTNLPVTISTEPDGGLVGRAATIADARKQLETNRLVTFTGPGGVGKTRLAVEVARAVGDSCADGVWIVELARQTPRASSTNPAQFSAGLAPDGVAAIAAAVATTLGVREDSAAGTRLEADHPNVTDRLIAALRARQVLVVLDNCEHVIEPVAHLVERLLTAAPRMRILVTSQEPVGLPDEVVFPVPPLEVPATGASFDDIFRSGAVRLFTTRASTAAGFVLSTDNAESVAEICRRLDGIPLAIELAATRVRALEVNELAARLDDRFTLLADGHRTAPPRQRTLRAMIDWSWELLPPADRVVLRRLAVPVGGCTLDAAEHVCAGDGIAAADVADVLRRLVDRSLVAVSDDGTARRYRLLESVAAYCWQRLGEADEIDAIRIRHATYYTDLAERAAPLLRGHGQRAALRGLDTETANLRVALESAVDLSAPELALRLVNSLAWYWFLRGRHQEARSCLTLAVGAAPPNGTADVARAEALTWLAGIAFTDYRDDPVARGTAVLGLYDELDDPAGQARAQWLCAFTMPASGDLAVGERLVSAALRGFRALGDRWGIAAALFTRAEHALVEGDLAAVRRDSEESLRLFDELGDRWGRLYPTRLLGILAEIAGDHAHAARLHRDALRSAEDMELWPSVSIQLSSLGRISLLKGDLAEADEYHQRAHRLAEELSDSSAAAFAAIGLGLGARRQGKLDLAERRFRDLLDWHHQTGLYAGTALILAELGFVAEQRGDAGSARALHMEGLTTARKTGDIRAVALALEGLAGVSALVDEPAHAARLLGAAAAARAAAGSPLPPGESGDVDRISRRVRAALGQDEYDAAFTLAGRLPLNELP